MATTTNFGWETPDDTDLVKDGAAAIRTALGGVDTSFVDLKGGTTGQVLAKASNTDLDFVWSADAAGIPLSIVDAKGDLIAATANDTPARLAVGTNGQVLTADSTASTGLKWATAAAGGYTTLASGSLSGNSLSLTSISGSYKSLRLILSNYHYDTRGNMQLTFNSDTASNYTTGGMVGTYSGTSYNPVAYSATGWSSSYAWLGNGESVHNASGNNIYVLDIPNYTDTSAMKVVNAMVFQRTNTSAYTFQLENHLWRGTSAITSLTVKAEGTRVFNAGTYTLLGQN
jgi:hypothetical protein